MSRLRAARSASASSDAPSGADQPAAEASGPRWPLRLGVLAVAAVGIGAPLAAAASHDSSRASSAKSDGAPSTVLARSAARGASVLAEAVRPVPVVQVAPVIAPAPPAAPVTLPAPPTTRPTPPKAAAPPTTAAPRAVVRRVVPRRVTTTSAAPRPKAAPQTTAAPRRARVVRSAPAPQQRSSSGSSAGNSVWDKIASCESGGNWSTNTGNGFYGGLQFTQSSWRAVGGTGSPQGASRETQIEMAKKLQAQQGWGAWPVCSRKAGLR